MPGKAAYIHIRVQNMGTSENIMVSVFVLIIFMVAVLSYAGISAKNKKAVETSFDEYSLDQKVISQFDTAISTTEPSTGRQFGDLLASAVYYGTDTINVSGKIVNITEEFDDLLDILLSGKEYYFEVTPRLTELHILFIISGEPRLDPVFSVLERDLKKLLADLNAAYPDMKVTGRVLVMEGSELCLETELDCSSYTATQIYHYNFSTDREAMKYRLGFFRPPAGLSPADDWETALSYHLATDDNYNLTNLEVIFPIIDSLPAASDTQKCPTSYADSIIGRDHDLISELGYIVDPIVVDNGDPGFCQATVYSHAEDLISGTKGITTTYSQNFLSDIHKIIRININNLGLSSGTDTYAEKRVIQRDIQLPNGEITRIRLHVYS